MNRKTAAVFAALYFTLAGTATAQTKDEEGYIDVHLHLGGMSKQTEMPPKDKRRKPPPQQRRDAPTHDSDSKGYEEAAANLIELMDEYGVEKALVMPPPQSPENEGHTKYTDLLGAVKKYPKRLYLAAGGDLLNPMIYKYKASEVTDDIKKQFRRNAEKLVAAGAKAFGEIAALHFSLNKKHIFMQASPDHPLFLLLADIAAENSIPIDWHMEPVPEKIDLPAVLDEVSDKNPSRIQPNIEAMEKLLAHNDKAKIVWQHLGWDNAGYFSVELVRRLLKAHPNLYFALRVEERVFAMDKKTPMPNRIVDKDWKIKEEWMNLFKEFPDRFVIGTDEFIGIPDKTKRMPQSFEETWRILDQMPEEIRKKIGTENAKQIYNL